MLRTNYKKTSVRRLNRKLKSQILTNPFFLMEKPRGKGPGHGTNNLQCQKEDWWEG